MWCKRELCDLECSVHDSLSHGPLLMHVEKGQHVIQASQKHCVLVHQHALKLGLRICETCRDKLLIVLVQTCSETTTYPRQDYFTIIFERCGCNSCRRGFEKPALNRSRYRIIV